MIDGSSNCCNGDVASCGTTGKPCGDVVIIVGLCTVPCGWLAEVSIADEELFVILPWSDFGEPGVYD